MAVEPVLNEGGDVSMAMVKELGWWRRMSLPSSTIEIRWPIPGDGYKTIVSITAHCNSSLSLSLVSPPLLVFFYLSLKTHLYISICIQDYIPFQGTLIIYKGRSVEVLKTFSTIDFVDNQANQCGGPTVRIRDNSLSLSLFVLYSY